jgi:hypothetical protein
VLIIRAGGAGTHEASSPALLHTIIKLFNDSGPVRARDLRRLEDEGLVIEEKLSGLIFFYPSSSAFLWLNNLPKSDFQSLNGSNLRAQKYIRAWELASVYSKAVFATITLPPTSVLPQKIQKFILPIITHRIKAHLRRRLGFSPPHIAVNEPQRKKRSLLSFHRHLVITRARRGNMYYGRVGSE